MALDVNIKITQNKRFDDVKKLIELKFYKVGDLCDLPLVANEGWTDWMSNFNDQICKVNGLDLQDQGNGTWKFVAYP